MKYFLLGAFSSAFLLFGIALLYGYAGTMSLGGISDALATQTGGNAILLAGTGLLGSACCSRWAPCRSTCGRRTSTRARRRRSPGSWRPATKIAAFIGLMRVFYVALGGTRWDWAPMMWVVAILTMVVGSIVAITQTDVKRMLAYSSIAHAGFLLTAFIGLAQLGNGSPPGSPRPRRCCSTWSPTASRPSARSPSSRWCGTPAARRPTCPGGPGWARSRRCWPASSRSSCCPSPASR